MLGLGSSNSPWSWVAHGKHPVARDYFTIGPNDPIAKAFCDWVDAGHQTLSEKRDLLTTATSYRFWSKASRKNELVCGVLRNSCDSIGRPFPLILLGSGELNGFLKNWFFLPLACDGIWNQMEHMAAKRYGRFDDLKDELRYLKKPMPDWNSIRSESTESKFEMDPRLPGIIATLEAQKYAVIPLTGDTEIDLTMQACKWHVLLAKGCSQEPNAVFIGGIMDQFSMVVFNRPLQPQDFIRLLGG